MIALIALMLVEGAAGPIVGISDGWIVGGIGTIIATLAGTVAVLQRTLLGQLRETQTRIIAERNADKAASVVLLERHAEATESHTRVIERLIDRVERLEKVLG